MFSQQIALESVISSFAVTFASLPFAPLADTVVFEASFGDEVVEGDTSNDAFTTFVSLSVPKPHINRSPAVGMSWNYQ